MLKKKRTKFSKMRGSGTHGGGHMKKRRGAGHRGGVGNAGSGARGDSKNQRFLKEFGKNYFGKRGFNSIKNKKDNTISLSYINNNIQNMEVSKEGVLDLTSLGYDKVLGRGTFNHKIKIKCEAYSQNSKQILEKAGCEILTDMKKEEVKE